MERREWRRCAGVTLTSAQISNQADRIRIATNCNEYCINQSLNQSRQRHCDTTLSSTGRRTAEGKRKALASWIRAKSCSYCYLDHTVIL